MRSLKTRILGAAAVAVLAGLAVAAEPTLSADVTGKAVEADTAHLSKLVELAKSKKKGVPARFKATAALLALAADENVGGKDGAKMAALRDAAVKLAGKAKTADAAGADVEALAKLPAGKAGEKPMGAEKVIAATKVELAEVMELFGGATAGGMNLEKDIQALKKEGVKNTAAAELIGARSALLAELTMHLPNDKGAAAGGKKDWDGYSAEMKKYGQDIAAEAAKGTKADLAKIKTAAGKLDASCTNCHNKFRD